MMNMDLTSKSAYKILQQLESDPQLQSVEDTTILNDEQYPIAFESSITNELEAELLTGKSLNYEKARSLALQGKTTEAASELLGQLGGLDEFQKLNVIQQDAIAKSIGMSADELADSYKQKELLNCYIKKPQQV